MLQKDDVIKMMDEFYTRTHIPLILTDESQTPIYPSIAHSLFFAFIPVDQLFATDHLLLMIEDQIAAYAAFPLSLEGVQYHIICGAILGSFEGREEDRYPAQWKEFLSLSAIRSHIATESLPSFQNFVTLLYMSLRYERPKVEYLEPIYLSTRSIDTKDEDLLTLRRLIQSTPEYYQWELKFFEAFANGEFNKINTLFSHLHLYDIETTNTNLEDTKYKLVSLITLLTRATIQKGASVESAFSLSDHYLQKIKQFYQIKEASILILEAIKSFYHLIEQTGDPHSYHIYQCIHYIDTHLYDKLSLKTLTLHTGLSSSYLSALFKKEMGESIVTYIQRKKIEEAERLLLFTNKSYSEISSLLNFNSQSNFIQIFKKFKHMTPRQCQLEKRKNL